MRFFLASCLTLFSFVIFSQTATISGKIIDDATDLGVPFATIQVKDTDKGTTADIEGNFNISAEKNQVLIVRMVGYIDQEFLVNNSTTLNVRMKNELLKELVVVGYGTQESEDITGSIVKVESDQIMQTAVAGAADALQGRAAGVEVVNNNGAPGSNTEVKLEGLDQ